MRIIPLLCVLLFLACNQASNNSVETAQPTTKNSIPKSQINQQGNETLAMAKELHDLLKREAINPGTYNNRILAKLYMKKIREVAPEERRKYWYNYCRQLLFAGETETCLKELTTFFGQSDQPLKEQLDEDKKPLFDLLALAYLRLGEQENCQHNHSGQSCIIPLKEGGVHQLTRGSEEAIKVYEILHEKFPSPTYKWILNLAHMTLGKYPEEVPSEYLINIPSKFEQKNFPTFKNVAIELGLDQDGLAGSTCIDDFNNDGFLDVFMTSCSLEDNVQLYINDQHGGFIDYTDKAGLRGIVGGFNCIQADYNNDGHKDILILRGAWQGKAGNHPNSLLKNMGDGTFQDVSSSAKLLSYHPTQTASWADFNNDGNLDLFIGNESQDGDLHLCELYRNNGNGTFSEVAREYGLDFPAFVKSVAWGDINNDGWPDLYISRLGGENLLFRNDIGRFTEIGAEAGISMPINSFPCWFWDINDDGFEDILVLTYDLTEPGPAAQYLLEHQGRQPKIERPKLYINNGDETFSERSEDYGLSHLSNPVVAMGANFGDLDNDGYLDYYVGTGAPRFTAIVPNRMFRNREGKKFEEVTSAGNFGHIQKGHGIAFADLDRDGDQDIYAVMGGFYEGDNFMNALYENPISENNWIVIELKGITINRSAIGARLKLELNNGRTIFRTVSSGGSFGASPLQREIGLGKADQIENLTIYWPGGKVQVFRKVNANQKVLIAEGENTIKPLDYSTTPFNLTSKGHHH